MQQFTLILKDNTQKAFRSFYWFLFFLHVIVVAAIIINTPLPMQKYYAIASLILFVVLTAAYYLPALKIKWLTYTNSMFVLMAISWLLQSAWLPALVVIIVIVVAMMVLKTKSMAIFSEENFFINKSLFKKKYSWNEVENVILKDHLLSIDFKNNHLIQVEITSESFDIDESAFNRFCSVKLKLKA